MASKAFHVAFTTALTVLGSIAGYYASQKISTEQVTSSEHAAKRAE